MADDIYLKVGAAIRKKRDKIGMTQASLANVSGIGRTSITNIEQGGQAIMLHQLIDVARALNADPGEFLREIEDAGEPAAAPTEKTNMADLLMRLDKPVRGSRR